MSKELYNDKEIALMKITKESNDKSRIQELIKYAKISNYTRIGIANCITMQKYAEVLKSILEEQGFSVFSIHCRESDMQSSDIVGEGTGSICDPISQAEYLNAQNTDLNINMGLCLGHGIIFNAHSNAPVTTLIVKDFANSHKTIDELIK